MGIYHFAVDHGLNQIINPPASYADKSPGVFHPNSPFPGMVIMMNSRGYNFEMVTDYSYQISDDSEDITDKVYAEYKETFKDHYKENS